MYKTVITILLAALAFSPTPAMSKSSESASLVAKKLHHHSLRRLLLSVRDTDYAAVAASSPAPPPPPQTPVVAKMTVAQARASPIDVLRKFDINDLQAALELAQKQTPPDQVAATCYETLIRIVQASSPNGVFSINPGMFEGTQRTRDSKNINTAMQSSSGTLAGLHVACAPFVLDPLNTLVTLGVSVGVVSQ